MLFSPNTPAAFKTNISHMPGVRIVNCLGKYLGVNIDLHQNKKEVYKDMVDRIQNKLHGWKAQLL